MDQVKIGAFIAALRREKGWTQEELGERVNVTNKTVSRWENGNYMPSIEILSLLSREFSVSLNELVQGQRLEEAEFRAAADQNLASALERPSDRFWKWMERFGVYAAMIFLLCCIIVVLLWAQSRYKTMHPGDVDPVGTWNTCSIQDQKFGDYIVLDRDGRYYRYRQFEPLEQGEWMLWSSVGEIVVTTKDGSFDLLVKGHGLFVPDGEGGLQYCRRLSVTPVFVNVCREDFGE